MTEHSLEGYLSALGMRTRRTLLVEGSSDRSFLYRLVRFVEERDRCSIDDVVIDDATLVTEFGGAKGARECILHAHSLAADENGHIAVFVDREWDGFSWYPEQDHIGRHETRPHFLFLSRGHSIENYALSANAVAAFLLFNCAEAHCAPVRQRLEGTVTRALRWASALSLAASDANLLGKTRGVVTHDCWDVDESDDLRAFRLDDFKARLAARGAQEEQLAAFVDLARACISQPPATGAEATWRWIAHGHLGIEMLWTCVAALCISSSVDKTLSAQISRGFVDYKMKTGADEWTAGIADGSEEEPSELISWLKRKSA